ncbi:MAG: hypothetical protein K0R51_620 [Cytophagaceae bacterium]|jgi:hypothetical protein|nr:hypothetical protein [Cytophagaceae bacterium]
MRTASKPHPNQVLVLPTREALLLLLDELILTEYSGKSCISKTEIKHIHLNYALAGMRMMNN